MKSGSDLWDGIQKSLNLFPYPLPETTIVGNRIKKQPFTSPLHWHALGVINVYLYGSAVKKYMFIDWDTAIKYKIHNTEKVHFTILNEIKKSGNFYSAEIGYNKRSNCIIWPPRMLHEITTLPGIPNVQPIPKNPRSALSFFGDLKALFPSKTESQLNDILSYFNNSEVLKTKEAWIKFIDKLPDDKYRSEVKKFMKNVILRNNDYENSSKHLYLGIGTYTVIDNDEFLVKQLYQSMVESEEYTAWTMQLDKTRRQEMIELFRTD